MASFPDLRPDRGSAHAEHRAARSFRRLARLLAVPLALCILAFVAVSELATLHGKKALEAPAFLTEALGSPESSAPLVRTPARHTTVTIGRHGYAVAHHGRSLIVSSTGSGTTWARFANGATRSTAFGQESIVVRSDSTELFETVVRRQGRRFWRWQLGTTGLTPKLERDGSVWLDRRHSLWISPIAIKDAGGRDVTPVDTRWS